MKNIFQFAFVPSIVGKAQVMTRELFETVINSRDVWRIVQQIRATKDKDERAKLKKKLTAICWHAWFDDGVRKNSHAHASGLVMIDLDHIDNPREVYAGIEEKAKAMGLVCAHVTPSGEGLRLVFVIPEGMGIVKSQQYFAKALNLTNVDECTKDLARLSFLVPQEDWLFIDWDVLFGDKEPPRFDIDIRLIGQKEEVPDTQKSHEPGPVHEAEGMPAGIDDKQYPDGFKGIAIEAIIHEYEQSKGGAPIPEPGNGRNNFYYNMALTLRGIFDNDPQWVFKALPTYGMEAQERWNTAQSACSYPFKGLTKEAKTITEKLSCGNGNAVTMEAVAKYWWEADEAPRMPKKLPDSMYLLIKNVPKVCRCAVASSVFSSLGVYLSQVTIVQSDNRALEPCFITVLIADSGDGKGSVDDVHKIILEPIDEEDMKAIVERAEWAEKCKTLGSNEQKPEEPKVCKQNIGYDATSASLAKLLDWANKAGGKVLFVKANEFDSCKKLDGGKALDIIRNCFDHEMLKTERANPEKGAVVISAPWRINFMISSTPGQACDNLGLKNMVNGCLGRLDVCTIQQNDPTAGFKYGRYYNDYRAEVRKMTDILLQTKGELECKEALKCADGLMCESKEYYAQTGNKHVLKLMHRAITIALWKGVILWLLNGKKWTREISDFMTWAFRYNMWCKLYYFGTMLDKAVKQENGVGHRSKKGSIIDFCPDRFTFEQYVEARKKFDANMPIDEKTCRNHLKVLKNRNEVMDEGNGFYRKLNKAS